MMRDSVCRCARCCAWGIALLLASGRISAQEAAETGNLWKSVQERAAAAGDRKAIWRELKKLSPEELLVCGEQFCRTEGLNTMDLIITTNAMLSYHQVKTSYGETATAVARIIESSANRLWIYAALEWIETNDHYKQIPAEQMTAIYKSMLSCLTNEERPLPIKMLVLKKACSYDIVCGFAPTDRANFREKVAAIAANHPNADLRKRAQKTIAGMAHVEEVIAEEAQQ
jgi:hypothetical protein